MKATRPEGSNHNHSMVIRGRGLLHLLMRHPAEAWLLALPFTVLTMGLVAAVDVAVHTITRADPRRRRPAPTGSASSRWSPCP